LDPRQTAILDWVKRANHLRAGIAVIISSTGACCGPGGSAALQNATSDRARSPGAVRHLASAERTDRNSSGQLWRFAESLRVELEGQGNRLMRICLGEQRQEQEVELPRAVDIKMEPRSLCLMELR
jgi:hypothetical protein